MDRFTVLIGRESFDTKLRSVGSVRIAYMDFLSDIALIHACADALVKILSPISTAIVVPETGAIPLGFALATKLNRPLVVLRKGHRGYMGPSLSVPVKSVAAERDESLFLEEVYLPTLRLGPVTLIDTVTSSGGTLRSMQALMSVAGVEVAETAVAFTEGEDVPSDVLAVGKLPVFAAE